MKHLWVCLMLMACTGRGQQETPPETDTDSEVEVEPVRVVAIGDVHGAIEAARSALSLAGVIDANREWVGGKTQVVQLGDQLDRGDDEQAILDWFEVLRAQAEAAGGGFHPLLGNHETMNVKLDLRYITAGGFADFADTPYDTQDAFIMAYPEEQRGRVAAFRPQAIQEIVLPTLEVGVAPAAVIGSGGSGATSSARGSSCPATRLSTDAASGSSCFCGEVIL